MKVQIPGSGCPKCRALEANAREALHAAGISAEIEKVTDMDAIVEMGVMVTPAIAINGVVRASGRVLKTKEIQPSLRSAGAE